MDNNILINRVEDLAETAIKKGFSATKFVTPAETSEIMRNFMHRSDVSVMTEGGYINAERVRIVFLNHDWGGYSRAELLSVLRISYRAQNEIGHRDVLGAILNLGLKRETIGDILVTNSCAFVICMPEIAQYIAENLTKIKHGGVMLTQIPLEQLPQPEEEGEIKTITVSSARLDGIISGIFNVSRSNASKLITQGRVKLAHIECLKQDKEINEDTVISVRGFGRAKILAFEGKTRKDRMRIKVEIYA